MKRIVPLLLLVAVLGSSLHAMDIQHYRDLSKKQTTDVKAAALLYGYILGLTEGFGLANVSLLTAGKPMLFCAPPDLSLNYENYLDMVDKAILSDLTPTKPMPHLKGTILDPDKQDVGLLLLMQLVKNFPCG